MNWQSVLNVTLVAIGLIFFIKCMNALVRDLFPNRLFLGYVERWNHRSTAYRSWYVLAIRVYTQRWTHSTWLM